MDNSNIGQSFLKTGMDVWGSCVSRTILNYTDFFSASGYLLQSPIHTLFSKGYAIDEKDVIADHNFDIRTVYLEFNKKQLDFYKNKFTTDYILIDFHDATRFYYEINGCFRRRIVETTYNTKTINLFGNTISYSLKSPFEIEDSEWRSLIKKFIKILHKKYDNSHIILNEFKFAKSYVDKDNFFLFNTYYEDVKRYNLACKLNAMFKKFLPDVQVLDCLVEPIADKNHFLSLATTHYVQEFYEIQAVRLAELLNLDTSGYNLENMISLYNDKYFSVNQSFVGINRTEELLLQKYYTLRLDVKNVSIGERTCELMTLSDNEASVSCPSWFSKIGGGFIVISKARKISLELKINNDGELKFSLKGSDVRSIKRGEESLKLPVFIPVYKFAVKNINVLTDETVIVDINRPFNYAIPVKKDEVVSVDLVWGIL